MKNRCEDWKEKLDAHVAAHECVPFDWLTHNCTRFATEWVRMATGFEMNVPVTPTALAAHRVIQELGGLQAEVSRQLGEALPGAMAQCGDFVLLSLPSAEGGVYKACGVCIGALVAAQGPQGVVMVPITEAEAAWRV
jgi:hypothetical protein